MRPRFEFQLPVTRETWLEALRSALQDDAESLRGQVFRKHAVVEMRDGERTLGRFSPHPNVWTMFMAVYILLALAALGGLSYGMVQYTLGQSPWSLWIVPAAVALFGFVYGATLIGQGLGAEQMYTMRSLIDRACVDALATRVGVDSPITK
jgi:uncharacterized integral membrane protein